jgi:hypothetical protein
MLAREAERFAAEEPFDDREPFVELGRSNAQVSLFAEGGELADGVAVSKPKREPPAGEDVERDRLARDQPRPATRQRRDHGTQPDAVGGQGDDRQQHPWIRIRHAGVSLNVIPDPHRIPTRGLGVAGDLGSQSWVGEIAEVGNVDGVAHVEMVGAGNGPAP